MVLGPGVAVARDRLRFQFSSSSGPGGQNVNKRATKCQLRVHLIDLKMREDQLRRFIDLAAGHLTDDGEVVISSDVFRSQERNKSETVLRLRELVLRSLKAPKVRRATKPTYGSRQRRLETKKRRGDVKRQRAGGED